MHASARCCAPAAAGADLLRALLRMPLPAVQAQLKPRFNAKQLDNDGCKRVLDKVVDKVMSSTTLAEMGGREPFMNERRQKKVAALIDSYAASYAAKRGGGGSKGGA